MSTAQVSPHHLRLIRKLETIATLGEEERRAIDALPMILKDVAENADIVSDGDTPQDCSLILDGFVARYQLLESGGRQIFSIHLPGDIPDLQTLHLKVMDHSVIALTPTRIALVPHTALLDLAQRYPVIAHAFFRDILIDAAVFRTWLANVGRKPARQRIAHLICEVYVRARTLGLAGEGGLDLPITQAELGDCLGLTSVHVNRTLQELRRDNLIASEGRRIRIRDWQGLQLAGEFDPTYLHLVRPWPGI